MIVKLMVFLRITLVTTLTKTVVQIDIFGIAEAHFHINPTMM